LCTYIKKDLNISQHISFRRTVVAESKDTKLTLRISEEDLAEIDEFLNVNPRFGSRSEFIRHSAMDYIAKSRIGIVEEQSSGVRLSRNLDNIIVSVVEKGFFKTRDEVIEELLKTAIDSGVLRKVIEQRIKSYNSIMNDLKKFESATERKEYSSVRRGI